MTTKPILFSTDMVRAILDGRKTMTRRIVKTKPGKPLSWPYSVGDLLWVRETFGPGPTYKADDKVGAAHGWRPSWKPSIFMPRYFSRITLRIVSIKIDRLQNISVEDCVAEGITTNAGEHGALQDKFRDLWDSLNASRGYEWTANPWVWVISFEIILENVDDVVDAAA